MLVHKGSILLKLYQVLFITYWLIFNPLWVLSSNFEFLLRPCATHRNLKGISKIKARGNGLSPVLAYDHFQGVGNNIAIVACTRLLANVDIAV